MDEVDERSKNLRSMLELMRKEAGETNPAAAEGLELFRAFFMIKNAEARREVINLAKRLSSN